jgi:predicted enzyme related to lactoylglutathione lyase
MGAHVDYFEIGSSDPDRSAAFYGGLFGWSFDAPTSAGYQNVDGGSGGLWNTAQLGSADWAIFYVRVESVTDAIAEAISLGAGVAIPRVENPQIVFAHLIDPLGNRFAVWHPKEASRPEEIGQPEEVRHPKEA